MKRKPEMETKLHHTLSVPVPAAVPLASRDPRPSTAPNDFAQAILAAQPVLWRYARSLCQANDWDLAPDLIQATNERMLNKSNHFYDDLTGDTVQRHFNSWAMTIMHNMFVNHIRQHARTRGFHTALPNEMAGEVLQPQLRTDERATAKIIVEDLRRLLEELPVVQSQVIKLICIDGLTYDECAEVLHVPVGTVRSRLSRGRIVLKDRLEGRETPRSELFGLLG